MILYKYLSPARIDVLKNLKIRYTQPGDLNDKYEVKPVFLVSGGLDKVNAIGSQILYIDTIDYSVIKEPLLEIVRKSKELDDSYIVKQISLVPQGTLEKAEYLEAIRKDLYEKNIFDKLILSLSAAPNKTTMWAHYTEQEKGFVIGFDTTHKYFKVNNNHPTTDGFINPVNYTEVRPHKYPEMMTFKDAYLTKYLDWQYEREYRICQSKENATEVKPGKPFDYYLFSFPAECISEIIFGVNTSDGLKDEITSLISGTSNFDNVKLKQAKESPSSYSYDIVDFVR